MKFTVLVLVAIVALVFAAASVKPPKTDCLEIRTASICK